MTVPPTTFVPFSVVAHGLGDVTDLGIGITPLLWLSGLAVVATAWWSDARKRPEVAAPEPYAVALGRPARAVLAVVGTVGAATVLLPAAFGRPDVGANPAHGLLFGVAWGVMVVASVLFGPVWRHVNPLRLVSACVARMAGDPSEEMTRRLPPALGVWPAVGSAAAFFVAREVVTLSGLPLLVAVLAYALLHVMAAAVYGGDWYAHADVFEVASLALGSLAVVGRDADGRTCWRRPPSGLAQAEASAGFTAFLAVVTGAALYDAATYDTTVSAPALLLVVCVAASYAAMVLATRVHALTPALVGVAVGHVAVDVFTSLLIGAQVTAVLASDPLGRGWNLLGLTGQEIVAEPLPAAVGVAMQVSLLLAGHVVAIMASDVIARRIADGPRAAALQLPLRAVVFASALAGVWLRLQ